MRKKFFVVALFLAACSPETPGDTEAPEEKFSPPTRDAGEIIADSAAADWVTPDPENTIYMDLPSGRVVILLSGDLAPAHVAQMKTLVREGYYDGLHFNRVIEGFVAQAGDPDGEKKIGSAKPVLTAEFDEPWRADISFAALGNDDGYAAEAGFINGFPAGRNLAEGKVWLAHCTGAFAYGREMERDSAGTEFYIPLQPLRYLDRNLSVFGRVIWGMEHIQALPRGAPEDTAIIADRNRWTPILSMKMAADIPEEERLTVEYFDTNSDLFSEYLDARRHRASEFFYYRPDYVALCQVPLPVRLKDTARP